MPIVVPRLPIPLRGMQHLDAAEFPLDGLTNLFRLFIGEKEIGKDERFLLVCSSLQGQLFIFMRLQQKNRVQNEISLYSIA